MARYFGARPSSFTGQNSKAVIALSACLLFLFSGLTLILRSPSKKEEQNVVVVEKEAKIDMIDVLVPLQTIELGQPLEPTLFRLVPKPRVGLNPRSVKSFEEIKGHFARALIVADEPLHRDYITNIKPTNPITANIPDGYRAVTIRLDIITGVEGWTQAGARVDVLWTAKIGANSGIAVIVENAKVMSAGRQTDAVTEPGAPVPGTATLLVTADDANKIQLAQSAGTLMLQLRGAGDAKASLGGTITVDDLIKGSKVEHRPDRIEGVLKMRDANGNMAEFALKSGRLQEIQK